MKPPSARPRYLDAITALFVTTLVVSNIIAGKQVAFTATVILPAAVILFPLTYILGTCSAAAGRRSPRRLPEWCSRPDTARSQATDPRCHLYRTPSRKEPWWC